MIEKIRKKSQINQERRNKYFKIKIIKYKNMLNFYQKVYVCKYQIILINIRPIMRKDTITPS